MWDRFDSVKSRSWEQSVNGKKRKISEGTLNEIRTITAPDK